MNVFAMITAVFSRGVAAQVKAAAEQGQRDGTAVADAYCDGFFGAAGDRFQQRLAEFHGEVRAAARTKRIARAK